MRPQWEWFTQSAALFLEAMGHWRESLAEMEPLDVRSVLLGLDPLLAELDLRLDEMSRLVEGSPPERESQAVDLAFEEAKFRDLPVFERASLAVFKSELEKVDVRSRDLRESIVSLRERARVPALPSPASGPVIDVERLRTSLQQMATIVALFLVWIFLDPPAGSTVFSIGVAFGLGMALTPQLRPSLLYVPIIAGFCMAAPVYFLIMPRLSGYAGLGTVIFIGTFLVYRLASKPQRALWRLIGIATYLMTISVENFQVYSFQGFVNSSIMMLLAVTVLVAMSHVPTSPRPEKTILRLLRRFFRSCTALTSPHDPKGHRIPALLHRWHEANCHRRLTDVPRSMAKWANFVDQRLLPGGGPDQVQRLVMSLSDIATRIGALQEASRLPQSQTVRQMLGGAMEDWRGRIRGIFHRWSAGSTPEPAGDLDTKLLALLSEFEERARAEAVTERVEELTVADLKSALLLLGSHRALSKALVDHDRIIQAIDWERWQEPQF
jgi:hypothetical protein